MKPSSSQKDYILSVIFNNPKLSIKTLLSYGCGIKTAHRILSERRKSGKRFLKFEQLETLFENKISFYNFIKNLQSIIPKKFPFKLQIWKAWSNKPIIILIHGFSLTKNSWINPYKEVAGGRLIHFDYLLTKPDRSPEDIEFPKWDLENITLGVPLRFCKNRPEPIWEYLKKRGFSLLTWSQQTPLGPMELALDEFEAIYPYIENIFGKQKKIVLVGHSRGGLIARAIALQRLLPFERIKSIILISCPNHGCSIIRLGSLFRRTRLSHLIHNIFKMRISSPTESEFIRRTRYFITDLFHLINTSAIHEMNPVSKIIYQFKDEEEKESLLGIRHVNIMGTNPTLNRIFTIRKNNGKAYIPTIDIFGGVISRIPGILAPHEIIPGKGDGMVAVKRAILGWKRHEKIYKLPVNHTMILVDEEVKKIIKEEALM